MKQSIQSHSGIAEWAKNGHETPPNKLGPFCPWEPKSITFFSPFLTKENSTLPEPSQTWCHCHNSAKNSFGHWGYTWNLPDELHCIREMPKQWQLSLWWDVWVSETHTHKCELHNWKVIQFGNTWLHIKQKSITCNSAKLLPREERTVYSSSVLILYFKGLSIFGS